MVFGMKKTEKPKAVEKLVREMKSYSVIGILNIHVMPAKPLQNIRQLLKGKAVIRVSKKNIIERALKELNVSEDFMKYVKKEVAVLLTNENPFKLYKFLDDNKTPAPAKVGDIAPKDITIKKGSTGIPPGPAISTLQKIGLKTSVQDGKIAVLADKVVYKGGQEITGDIASVFSLLKMEPMEVGLNLVAILEQDVVYDKSILAIDQGEYLNKIKKAVQQAVNFSINIDYPTKMTIKLMLQKSFWEARSLALEADVLEPEIVGDIIAKAVREAKKLESNIGGAKKKHEEEITVDDK